jgi:hypothetical protein
VDTVRLINNLICALGSLTVALAMLVLLWLPSRPFMRLQINLTADSQPVVLNFSGYEALMMANGLTVIPAKASALLSELQTRPGGAQFTKPYELSERQQSYLRDVASSTANLTTTLVAFQIAFFVLPASALLMALVVATTRSYFGEQLFKGIMLIGLTAAAVLVMAGGMLYLNELLNAVIAASLAQNQAGFPGLYMPVNDALPELRVGVLNLMDVRTPVIAAGVALLGAVIAMLGGALSARKPGLSARQLVQATMLQAQLAANGGPVTPTPQGRSYSAVQPTLRLGQSPPSPTPAAAQPTPPSPSTESPTYTPPLPHSPASARRRVCPSCGQPAFGSEKFCRSCGARLPSP